MSLLGGKQNQDQNSQASNSDESKQAVEIVFYISLSLSIFSNLIIILSFIFFKTLRKFPFNLIFYTALTCFIDDLTWLIGEAIQISHINLTLCVVHGFFVSFFELMSCTYSAGIAYAIILKTLHVSQETATVEKCIHILSISIASICSVVPFFNNDYTIDIDGNTCWIKDPNDRVTLIMQLASYYIIVWIEMFLILYWFSQLVHFYKSYMTTEENREIMGEQFKTAKQLLFYPIVMLFLVMVKTIYRIIICFYPEEDIKTPVTSIVDFLGNSQGTMDFLVFGMTGMFKSRLKERIHCCFANTPPSETFLEEEKDEIKKNNLEALHVVEKEESWENIDREKIEEEINRSLN